MTTILNHAMVLAAEGGAGGAGAGGDGAPPGGGWTIFIPMIGILIVFFWLSHRSQKKKQQQREDMLDGIEVKDRVVTIGGIHGRVVSIQDDTFILRVDKEKDVRIRMERGGISRRLTEEGEEEQA